MTLPKPPRPAAAFRLIPTFAAAALLAGCIVVVPLPGVTTTHTKAAAPRDLGQPPASANCPAPADLRTTEAEVIRLVNAERGAKGLKPLRASATLRRVAQKHACDMAAQGMYTHTGSDGSDLGTRLKRDGYTFRLGAENTARGFDTAESAVRFWLGSTYHRSNILNPGLTEIGVGLARPTGDRPYWVQVFATAR